MWKTVKLGDVCTITTGSTPLRKEKLYWEEGSVPWFTIDDFRLQGKNITYTQQNVTQAAVDDKKVKLVPANSVLLCCTASIGEVAIARVEMATNQQFNALTPKSAVLNSDYLYFVATTLTETLLSVSGSTTINFISMGKLKEISIPLPPLAEQERIVAKLDDAFAEIDGAIEVVNERYNNTNSLIATAQNALFEDMPLSIPRLKLSEAAKFENGDRGKNYPSKKYQLSEGIPFVNAGDFSLDGDITRDGMAYISEERFDLLGAGKFQKDDVLFCLRGSLGKSAINKTLKRGAIASSLVIIRALQDVYPDYLFAFIRSDIVKKYISETAGGTAQPNLSAKVVMGYEIPAPSLQEQEAIADKFWALRLQGLKATSLIKKKKSELMALKIAILTQELQSPESEVA